MVELIYWDVIAGNLQQYLKDKKNYTLLHCLKDLFWTSYCQKETQIIKHET